MTDELVSSGSPQANQIAAEGISDACFHHGRIFVVPVRATEPCSSNLIETLYRAFEIGFAAFGLIVGLPVMVIAAILIRLDSPGPVLFRHWRPARSVKRQGRDLEGIVNLRSPEGRLDPDTWYYIPTYFKLVKFRTMYGDSLVRFPDLYVYDGLTSEEFRARHSHVRNDPRITRIGKYLRKLSIDELPNLWSVLIGDLRLVGPRPENPCVLQHYRPEEMYKFSCKPGVTGLAQVSGRGLLDWGDTVKLDLEYIRTRSVVLDLKILMLTIKYVVTRHGAW